ncbi:MAG: DUF192 domain-containing protein [Candidatus Aenigmarchaeota archaeon]|nr:DUF192 domain-containing protein [Candidatus Aenigmarchaeota archaeon]
MCKIIKFRLGSRNFRVKDCRGLSSLRGLMFDDSDVDGALIHANSIWMPFVKHDLDLFFLDKKMKVVEKQRAVPMTLDPRTWKTYSNSKAKYCLEIKSERF